MKIAVMWFRRDLRLEDNAALYHALKGAYPVLPLFIFDKHILDKLANPSDARVTFICNALQEMQAELQSFGSTIETVHAPPEEAFRSLMARYTIAAVYTNHDYEPYARERDAAIGDLLQRNGISFHTFKNQVIFEKNEVVKDDGRPYTIFTPYARKWREKLNEFYLEPYPVKKYSGNFLKMAPVPVLTPEQTGFVTTNTSFPSKDLSDTVIKRYDATRDYPALANGTSRMGVHLRFGTVSIRSLAKRALELNATYLNELVWRDFYQMILWHFPQVGRGMSFKPAYDTIRWRNNEAEFEKWCSGNTGYPIVDAGMRELNATGYMHNRVRMITASFLAKHLLIDWRWGEAYFAEKLLDYDLAANNGGWQWAAGSGCDAAPYFRVFNPQLQTQKFDKDLKYVRKWVPELDELTYAQPIVPHDLARKRALEAYGKALKES